MDDNISLAEKSGNKLTQYRDEDGNLVNSTIESSVHKVAKDKSNVSIGDIEQALFNSEHIATSAERAQHDAGVRERLEKSVNAASTETPSEAGNDGAYDKSVIDSVD